jgi:peptidoglycan/LPS O-acetylase OafA/YrhL
MRSSSGEHYLALDHVRAVAVFMVFCWHFMNQVLVPREGAPGLFVLALLDEGHTGVSLFMTLSGYLFAKLLQGREVRWPEFFWNRFLRLAPLLLLLFVLVGIQKALDGADLREYVGQLARGIFSPRHNHLLPHASWSIPIEVHFYLLLPAFLWVTRKSKHGLWIVLALCIANRALIWHDAGDVQFLAYWTLVGRIDQFLLGILAFRGGHFLAGRHALAIGGLLAFCAFYWAFDAAGGFYGTAGRPAMAALWIAMPTLEGAAYALGIAWYDRSFQPRAAGLSRWIGLVGVYSYSIYLLHVFVTRFVGRLVRESGGLDFWSFYAALPAALLLFMAMIPIGYLSFRFIESPFLRLRRIYVRQPAAPLASTG